MVRAGDEAADLFVGGECDPAFAGHGFGDFGDDTGWSVFGRDDEVVCVIDRDGAEAVPPWPWPWKAANLRQATKKITN